MPRTARDDEMGRILGWRNHHRVRSVSLDAHEIGPAEHANWFAARQTDPASRVLIFEYDGVPSGVVTFSGVDPERGTASWGFYLDLDGLDERGDTLRRLAACAARRGRVRVRHARTRRVDR